MSDVLANGLNVNVNIQPSAEPDAGHIEVNILPTQSGEKGDDGATFRPQVDENGILSWTNDKNLDNPEPVNIKGPEGDPGKEGGPGKSAYEIAKDNGFDGTEEEWLESLKGKDGASDKIFIIQLKIAPTTTTAYYHGYKYAKIKEAIDGGKAVILIDPNGKVYTLNYVLTAETGANDNYLFHATAEYVKGQNANKLIADTLNIATDDYAYIYETELKAPSPRSLRIYDDSPQFIDEYDGSESKQIYLPTKLKNPYALHLRGAVNADYDGSSETTVNIPVGESTEGGTGGNASAFVVKVTYYFDQNDNGDESIYTADKTHAEIREAVERGDIVICELNYNYKANGATGSTGFDPLYLPYVTRSRNNLLCFAATFQNGFVFPYSGADSNHVVVTLDKNATPNVYFKSFVHRSDLPYALPNPQALIVTQGSKRWNYYGDEAVIVDLDPPTTSLPWTAITDKPFGDAVVFNDQITFANAMMPILTPFTLVPGKTYKIIAGYPPEDGMEFTAVAEEVNLLGVPVIGLGNYGALIEGGEDTGEVYAIISIPNGVDFSGNGTLIYGLIAIVDPTLQSMFVGNTFPVRIEEAEGAKPIPTEWINYGKANAGKLLYVKDDGTLEPLTLGTGLKIVNGVLTIEASTARAIAGMALAGQIKVGEV